MPGLIGNIHRAQELDDLTDEMDGSQHVPKTWHVERFSLPEDRAHRFSQVLTPSKTILLSQAEECIGQQVQSSLDWARHWSSLSSDELRGSLHPRFRWLGYGTPSASSRCFPKPFGPLDDRTGYQAVFRNWSVGGSNP